MRVKHLQPAMVARLMGCLTVAALLMGSSSCPRDLASNVDSKFSVNLVRPSATWPKINTLSPGETEAYGKYGQPDYFRVWYNKGGEIATSREAGPIIRGRQVSELPRSWIYEAGGIELRFVSPTKFMEVPISDQIKVLCQRGDPQERDVLSLVDGKAKESWTYWDVGEKYFFLDGKQIEKQVFKAIGKPFTRM